MAGDIELRDYQREVVEPALEGKNIIIWLPTGAGKTRAAVYVCKRHLESRRNGKVAVLVNMVPLVDQHLKNEFSSLQNRFNVKAISSDSREKMFFSDVVKDNDLILCTAQILQNALNSQDEDVRVELTDFSLLVIDECHHTHKETTYNKIMEEYLKLKLRGQGNLPQILGLTASLGTGGATSLENARDHILQICANLDADAIRSTDKSKLCLEAHSPQPKKQYDLSERRLTDPFGAKLKELMFKIYNYLDVPELTTDFGSQIFEQQVVELEKEGAKNFCRKTRLCALHLRKYNDALLVNDTVRMIDAFNVLEEFYLKERATKVLQSSAEGYLLQLFEGSRDHLFTIAKYKHSQNPRLCKLQKVLQDQFLELKTSQGIVFTRTRQSAHYLHQWIEDNQALSGLGIKAAVLTGAAFSSQTKHMTQQEQQAVIHQFRKGALNLLFSTSVAEEGLDIPECNFIIRYGLMTNEIAMMQFKGLLHHLNTVILQRSDFRMVQLSQPYITTGKTVAMTVGILVSKARGRARAPNSVYSVLAKVSSKEVTREKLNETLEVLMEQAISLVQQMPRPEYHLKIAKLQRETVARCSRRDTERDQLRRLFDPSSVRFYCVNCNIAVCHGSDLRKVENMHHVNVNPNFSLYYKASAGLAPILREFKDWRPGHFISCKKCGQTWGMEMIYKSVTLPMLAIKHFVVETPDGRRIFKKWTKVTFNIEEFDFLEYCSEAESN